MQPWLLLVNVGVAIWVSVDSSRLDARRGALGGGMLDMGPAGWFFACLLFWIVTFPCYLATRPKLVRRARALATHPQFAAGSLTGIPATSSAMAYGYLANSPQAMDHPTAAAHPGFAPPASGYPAAPAPGYYPNPQPGGIGTWWWDGTRWAGDNT